MAKCPFASHESLVEVLLKVEITSDLRFAIWRLSFHMKGWGPKSSVCPLKPRETKLMGGISRDLDTLPLTILRAKLLQLIFMNQAENWAKNSAHPRASSAVQNDPSRFLPKFLPIVTPRLVAEMSKFHLRELLGLGGPKDVLGRAQKVREEKAIVQVLGPSLATPPTCYRSLSRPSGPKYPESVPEVSQECLERLL